MAEQRSDPAYPYPGNDAPLTLSSGTVVRVRNLIVFRGQNTRQLTVVMETPTPADASIRLADEARELADMHRGIAEFERLDGITITICRSQACLELREPAAESFHFTRAADGGWTA